MRPAGSAGQPRRRGLGVIDPPRPTTALSDETLDREPALEPPGLRPPSRGSHARVRAPAVSVGSNRVGFGGLDQVMPLLDIPAELEVLAIPPLGHPAPPVGQGKKRRKPLREVAPLERYGRPFE